MPRIPLADIRLEEISEISQGPDGVDRLGHLLGQRQKPFRCGQRLCLVCSKSQSLVEFGMAVQFGQGVPFLRYSGRSFGAGFARSIPASTLGTISPPAAVPGPETGLLFLILPIIDQRCPAPAHTRRIPHQAFRVSNRTEPGTSNSAAAYEGNAIMARSQTYTNQLKTTQSATSKVLTNIAKWLLKKIWNVILDGAIGAGIAAGCAFLLNIGWLQGAIRYTASSQTSCKFQHLGRAA